MPSKQVIKKWVNAGAMQSMDATGIEKEYKLA